MTSLRIFSMISFSLTIILQSLPPEQGKNFLTQMCKKLNDFNSQTAKDETFWRDFLFYSYTGASEGVETETVPRDDFDAGFFSVSVVVSVSRIELLLSNASSFLSVPQADRHNIVVINNNKQV